MAEGPPEPPGADLRGLVPPSHFTLRPPAPSTSRMLEVEKRRSQALGAELEAERRRSHSLEAELETERRRGQTLGAALDEERRRSRSLEAELEAERRRSLRLGEELEAERGRGQDKGAGPDGEKPLEEPPLLLHAQLSALSHILTLQERELNRELPPPRLQALLGRWRQKVFALLVQLRVQDENQRALRVQEVTRERGRAEAAEQAVRGLSHAITRLAVVVTRCEEEVMAAIRAMAALSDRLHRAGQQLRVLKGLMVAPNRPRWHREAAGERAEVTRGTRRITGMGAELQRGVSPLCPVVVTTTSGVAPERVMEDGVTQEGVSAWDSEVAPRGDSTGSAPSRVSLCSLVAELQAMGAAILSDPP